MQVVSRKLFALFEIVLSFCAVSTIALESVCAPARSRGASLAGSAPAAAQKAMVLAQRFTQTASDLIAVLAGHKASRVADTEHAKLLEALNFNGFYNGVLG